MKRLGIFVFYDKEGIVDRYVQYLLRTMRKHVAHMVVVCNGTLSEEGKCMLQESADELHVRENKGFDAMALKLVLTKYVGWEKITSYDEAVFFNDTFYGPIYPWREVFDAMDKKEIDFWGLTGQAESADYFFGGEKKTPAYIQSFFWAFRRSVLCNPWFQEYWNKFDSTDWIFSDVTNKHEKLFTRALQEQGFSCATYVNADLFESTDPGQNFVQYYYIAYQLIKEYRCPVIKRKNFIMKHLTENPGEQGNDTAKALEFIKTDTDYDINLIWDNLLRIYDMQDIKNTLNLNYIVSENTQRESSDETALILWLSYESCLPQYMEYIKCLGKKKRIYIYSESQEILRTLQAHLRGKDIRCEQIGNTDICYFIYLKCRKAAETYKYLIFLHDIDYCDSGHFCLQQYSLLDHLWGNLLKNDNYVSGMEELFCQHERLGMLVAPQPVYGTYFSLIGEKRHQFFSFCCRGEALIKASTQNTKQSCDLQEERELFSTESSAMETLILQFQRAGYYTADVMNTDHAVTVYSQTQALLGRILQQAKRRYSFSNFDSYLDGEMISYARRFPRVLVYGAGENGYRAAHLIKKHGLNFAGFVVSDGQNNVKEKYGYPVYALSELKDIEKEGIVVSVANPKAQREIEKNLAKHNCTDIYFE